MPERFPSAAAFMPTKMSLAALRAAAAECQGCDLFKRATQTVFGEGARGSRLMLVGEQPGDVEDRAGKPFVGPAGRLLDDALVAAGINRSDVYVTNAVKHFKWEPQLRGKRRIHSKPSARQMAACRPWLDAEISLIKPTLVICLGATAAQSLLGAAFKVTRSRGEILKLNGTPIMATVHPSSLLRMPDPEARRQARESFIADLKTAADFIERS